MVTTMMRFGFAALTLGAWLGMSAATQVQADDYCYNCDSCQNRSGWSGLFSRCNSCGHHWCTCHRGCSTCNGCSFCGRRYGGTLGSLPQGPYIPGTAAAAGAGVAPNDSYFVGRRYYRWLPETPYTQTGGHLQSQYPVIYWPTDTTQLGVYHQHVPYWRPLWAAY